MFHIIHKQPLCLPSRPAPLLFLIPLPHGRIAIITQDNILSLYCLDPPTLLLQISLQSRPRRAVPVGNNSVALLMPSEQTLIEVHFGKQWQKPIHIHKFKPTTHHLMPRNPIKQQEYFSTMCLSSFLLSDSLLLREQHPESKKSFLHFFSKTGQSWQESSVDLGINYFKIDKIDEEGTVAVFNSSIQNAGSFRFKKINSNKEEDETVVLESQSFTDYAVVIAVKRHGEDLFVQVNQKNSELICFRNHQEHHSENTVTCAIWVITVGPLLYSLCFSPTNTSQAQLQVRRGTELMDVFQDQFKETAVSKEGLVVEYQKQREGGQHRRVNAYRLIRKDKLYLHLMKAGFKQGGQRTSLLNEVLSLLAD